MSDPTLQDQIAAADAYDTLMVPALFGEWAPRVVDAAGIRPGHQVLDVACGTGVLAREAARRVEPGGSVVGLDPHPGMLAVAKRHAPALDWRQGTAEQLPFQDGSLDAVVSQFGFMFFGDRSAAVRETVRVLVPGGRLAVAVWDGLESMPAYAEEVALLDRVAGRDAADALRAPFVLGRKNALAALFDDGPLTSLRIATQAGTARFPSVRVMVEADLRGWLPAMGVVLSEEQIERILEEAEDVLAPYVTTGGAVTFPTSAHILTGTAAPEAP